MAGSHNTHIRKGEPYQLRILEWKDAAGNVVDPTGYTWQVRTADGLSITGTVASGHVSFPLTAAQTAALAFENTNYAAVATPVGGGEPTRVLAGRMNASRDPLS